MGKKLYVGNLGYDVSSSDLETLLAPHGTVLSAEVISDRSIRGNGIRCRGPSGHLGVGRPGPRRSSAESERSQTPRPSHRRWRWRWLWRRRRRSPRPLLNHATASKTPRPPLVAFLFLIALLHPRCKRGSQSRPYIYSRSFTVLRYGAVVLRREHANRRDEACHRLGKTLYSRDRRHTLALDLG